MTTHHRGAHGSHEAAPGHPAQNDPAKDEGEDFFSQRSWEERYAGPDRMWSGRPNAQLVAETAQLTPGTALDVAAGEGGDALWLVEQGWQVTGLDFSSSGLRRAESHAIERGLAGRVAWLQADLREWESDGRRWDLVTSHYMHLPDGGMVDVARRLAAAVTPGGPLLVGGHHPTMFAGELDEAVAHHGEAMFTAEQIAVALHPDQWDIRAQARERQGTDPDGHAMTMIDAVLVATRRADNGVLPASQRA